MNAQTIRFLVQAAFAVVAMLSLVFLPMPYGAVLGAALLLFGLWLGRRIFSRIATLDEIRADLRQRVDEGP